MSQPGPELPLFSDLLDTCEAREWDRRTPRGYAVEQATLAVLEWATGRHNEARRIMLRVVSLDPHWLPLAREMGPAARISRAERVDRARAYNRGIYPVAEDQ